MNIKLGLILYVEIYKTDSGLTKNDLKFDWFKIS